MPQILIQNEKNLFGELSWSALISEVGLARLGAMLPVIEQERPDLFADARDFHDLCSALPQSTVFLFCQQHDLLPGETLHANGAPFYGWRPARGWIAPTKFIGKSASTPPTVTATTPEALGWRAAEIALKREKAFTAVAQYLGITPPSVAGAKGLLKKSEKWTIVEHRAHERLASADAFAIYLPRSQGYLNDKGSIAVLGGARLFESAEAASRTITSRRLASQDAVVVTVEARVKGVDPIIAPSGDLGPLGLALAHEEARQLKEALAQATVESLRARLAELEAIQPATPASSDEAETPVPKKASRPRL